MQSGKERIYSFYGYRLQSALPLSLTPELAPDTLPPDVTVTAGDIPREFRDPVWSSPFVSVAGDGRVLISVETAGRFLVQSGNLITVQAKPGAAPAEIEAFLMGPVAGALLHQRGVLPLHASCIEAGGVAIALAGSTGQGKSTLAAALVRRGARLMSDDICPVTFCRDGGPAAIPGSAGMRLRSDTREALRCEGPGWLSIRPGHAKQVGRWNAHRPAEPLLPCRLGAIVRLAATNLARPRMSRLRGPAAMSPMKDLIYRFRIGRLLGRSEDLFRGAMRLADEVPVFELTRPYGFERLEEITDSILRAATGRD